MKKDASSTYLSADGAITPVMPMIIVKIIAVFGDLAQKAATTAWQSTANVVTLMFTSVHYKTDD